MIQLRKLFQIWKIKPVKSKKSEEKKKEILDKNYPQKKI
jgi:hypothetical protein